MNELDNPFTSGTVPYGGSRFAQPYNATDDEQPDDTAPELDALPKLDALPAGLGTPAMSGIEGLDGSELFPTDFGAARLPEPNTAALPQAKPAGKLKLQKVHRLFEWVHQGCRKYGHEHMTIMIDAYRSMDYISEDVSDQIGEIMRMAPETRAEVRDIGPNEFVSELYVLNRILDPDDATLDRDMIEVLMLSRRDAEAPDAEKVSSKGRNAGDTWIELLDRI